MRKRLHALWHHLKNENATPTKLAWSVFVGLFLGVVPLYGVQTLICLAVAWLFRLNKLTVVAAAQISIPPFAPFLVAAGIVIGELVRFGEVRAPDLLEARGFLEGLFLLGGELPDLFLSCFVGDTLLGLALGAGGAGFAYYVASRRQAEQEDA